MASKSSAVLLSLNIVFFAVLTSIPSSSATLENCPDDALKLSVCADVLGVLLKLGEPQPSDCCSLINNLINIDAAACLCTSLKINVLDVLKLDISGLSFWCMRKARSSVLLPFDFEIERTCRRNRKEKRATSTQQTSTMDPNIGNNDQANDQRALRDYAIPTVNRASTSIRRLAIQANNFEIKPAIIQMIQTSVQFNGLTHEDPNAHIANFLEICDTFRYNGVSDDAVKLRLFSFSLRDKAKSWLSSLPPGTIITWDDLAQKFLAKFFPPTKTAKLRNDIATFTQFDGESLYEAWERYKEMMRRCPYHGLPKWLQVQTFYNGLGASTKTLVDAATGGALMSKSIDEAYELLEEMARNAFQWPSKLEINHKTKGTIKVNGQRLKHYIDNEFEQGKTIIKLENF
ncbi:Bifunctional inhibitor/lipid-transfer protein/seed storage 2S albumin superfamily protein [Melia azedarach]|uniref:Bifunctional inhibitor/lipid-transfer protein/seed storage 2S albumin superfamily protein n=1 Tax=Melia azedarach TaxID=155640 RepID=A0ACC1XPI3_MELAZ|nr:Bifunctional inhibitor/lipid-transfer protein/seed storage 2S albumin superfamily protein [Melia azedarach]